MTRRLTASEKKLRGTLRKDRERRGVHGALAEVGPPPVHFTVAQKAAWADLAPQVRDVYTEADRAAFSLLVKQAAELDTNKKLPPYVRAQLTRSVLTLLEAFGCTPSSRRRVDPVKPEAEDDPAAAFLFGNAPLPPRP